LKFAPMANPAMALLQQQDARRGILIEPAERRRAAIEARGHSELRTFGTGGVQNWGRNRAVKTHRLVCLSVCWPDRKPEGPLFSAEFVCESACLCL